MLKRIEPDKLRHFYVGIGMGAVLQVFASFLLQDQILLATIIAFILVLTISYGFELFSKITGLGRYDFIDAVASAIGGVLGMGLSLFVEFYFLR